MSAPTPVTMKSIERLSGSRVSPSGMEKAGPRLIQEREGAPEVCWKKMMAAQTKLPSTAPTEMKALSVRSGRVALMMTNAETSGRRSAIQGSVEVIATLPLSSRSGEARRGTPQMQVAFSWIKGARIVKGRSLPVLRRLGMTSLEGAQDRFQISSWAQNFRLLMSSTCVVRRAR